MNNLIPEFIQSRIDKGEREGRRGGAAMFMDISGFTAMTEHLQRSGKEGAEVLSAILNNIFLPVIDAIYQRGGFITGFAGDALTAIFHVDHPIAACYAADSIQKIFARDGMQKSRLGDFELAVKVGLSAGELEWGIPGTDEYRTYFFRGAVIDGCARAEHHCEKGQIVLDTGLKRILAAEDVELRSHIEDLYLLEKIKRPEIDPPPPHVPEIRREIAGTFLPESILSTDAGGEFRGIVSVFLSFKEPEGFAALDEMVKGVLEDVRTYGGYFNSLDFGDKGGTMLIFFGAPSAHEDDPRRAADFVLSVRERLGDNVRAGITSGTAYAGVVGSPRRCAYTCLGDVVNLSARIMMKSTWGGLWSSFKIHHQLQERYHFESLGKYEFKGLPEPMDVCELKHPKKQVYKAHYSGALIGRDGELEQFREWLRPLSRSRFGGVVYVYGDAGVGKSRLLHEVIQHWKDEGGREDFQLQVDGILRKSLNPFAYFLEQFFRLSELTTEQEKKEAFDRELNRQLERLQDLPENEKVNQAAGEIMRTRSLLGALVGLFWQGSLYDQLDAKGRFENTMVALKEFMKAMSLLKPTVLMFEDVHWLDEDSRRVIESLTRNTEEYPMLIIASGRFLDDGSKPRLNLDDKVPQNEMTLTVLPASAVPAFVEQKLGKPADEELLGFIQEKTEGNPLYVEQFCLYLQENDHLLMDGELVKRKDTGSEIPSGITAILVSRIDRLSPELKDAVQAASVLGREFDSEVLSRMIGGKAPEDLHTLMINGENEQIWTHLSEIKYFFKHGLLRDAAYDMQLRDRLRTLHGKAGDIIESRPDFDATRFADLAFHYEQAEIEDKARVFLGKAGDYARDNYKSDRALHFYDRLLGRLTDTREKIQVYARKGQVLDLTGRWDETEELLREGMRMGEQDGLNDVVGSVKAQLGQILQKKGENDSAEQLLQEAIDIAKSTGDVAAQADGHINLGRTHWSMGKYDLAHSCFTEAKSLKQKTGDLRGIALAQYYEGIVYRDQGDYDQAMGCYEESLQIFEELDDKRFITYPIYDIGVIFMYKGELDRAREYLSKALAIYEEIGYLSGASAALLNLGVISARRGLFKEAHEYYDESLRIAEELGERLAIAYTLFSIGTIYYYEQDYRRTLEYFEKSFAVMKEVNARGYYGYIYAFLTCSYAREGQPARALKAALLHLKNIQALGSDVENGRTHMGIALVLHAPTKLQPNARKLMEEITTLTGLPATAEAYFEEAIRRAEESNYINTLIPALREYAVHAFRAAQTDEARETARARFELARDKAKAAGMEYELQAIESSTAELGCRLIVRPMPEL